MKIIALILGILLLSRSVAAQTTVSFIQGPTIVQSVSCQPIYASDGVTITAAPVTATSGFMLSNSALGMNSFVGGPTCSFDLVALGSTQVTAGGVTVTYSQLLALAVAAVQQQIAAQQAAQAKSTK